MNGDYTIPEFISDPVKDLLVRILNIDPVTRYSVEQIKAHPWYSLSTPLYTHEGLIIGYNRIPIRTEILSIMKKQGFDPSYIE